MILREILLPKRLPRKLLPKFIDKAERVSIYAHAYNEIVPAEDLTLKYIGSHTIFNGYYGELYAFIHSPNDVDAVMSIYVDGEGKTHYQIARMAGAQLDVYFDGVLKKTFPKDSDVGYFTLVI